MDRLHRWRHAITLVDGDQQRQPDLAAVQYRTAAREQLLPALDVALLCSFLDRRSAMEAMRDFRDGLRARP